MTTYTHLYKQSAVVRTQIVKYISSWQPDPREKWNITRSFSLIRCVSNKVSLKDKPHSEISGEVET